MNDFKYENQLRKEIKMLCRILNRKRQQLDKKSIANTTYVAFCNQYIYAFVNRLEQYFPNHILKEFYQEAFPLSDTLHDFQSKIQILEHSKNNNEITITEFEQEVLQLIYCLLKVIQGKMLAVRF